MRDDTQRNTSCSRRGSHTLTHARTLHVHVLCCCSLSCVRGNGSAAAPAAERKREAEGQPSGRRGWRVMLMVIIDRSENWSRSVGMTMMTRRRRTVAEGSDCR